MMKLLPALLLMLLPHDVFAATRTAASLSMHDVQAAIDASAASGDTVILLPGTATWTYEPVDATHPQRFYLGYQINGLYVPSKGIKLQGAGTTSGLSLTEITLNLNNLAVQIFGNSTPFEMTGISWKSPGHTQANQFVVNLFGPMTQFRVHDCKFTSGNRILSIGDGPASGPCRGVVDHCQFIDSEVSISVGDVRTGDVNRGDRGWTEPVRPGTDEAVYVEDCTFTHAASNDQEDIYCQRAARLAVRHCTFTTAGYSVGFVDAHGRLQDRGTLLYEFSCNTFTYASGFRFVHVRGGSHLFFNNTFNGPGNPIELDGDYGDYLTDCYFWGNVQNGSVDSSCIVTGGTPITSVGIGGGEPGGGGPHVGSYSMLAPASGQRFYPYMPYVYPHPLASGSPTPTPTPTPAGFPVITQQPSSQTQFVGFAPTFSVTIGSVGGIQVTYTWKKNGSTVRTNTTGGLTDNYTGANATLGDNGALINCTISTSGGSVISNTVTLTVLPMMTWPDWAAKDGLIKLPFAVNGDDTVSQPLETSDLTASGEATYPTTVPTPANVTGYTLSALVDCPDNASNSFFIDVDNHPDMGDTWFIPITTGLEERDVIIFPETVPHVWMLPSGVHTVYLKGREANAKIKHLTFHLVSNPSPTPTPTATPMVNLPTFTPNGGSGITSVSVALAVASPSPATIKFTRTGEHLATANPANIETLGPTPVPMDRNGIIYAVGSATGYTDSAEAASLPYVVSCADPTLAVAGGTGTATVTINCTTPSVDKYYSIDGSAPSLQYSVPVIVNATCTFKSQTRRKSLNDSAIVSQTVTVTSPSPTPTPTPTPTAVPTATPTPGQVSNIQWTGP